MKLQFKDPAWPEELAKLLSFINNETGVFPVIAGGAVRDGILGGPVRDIDMYVGSKEFSRVRYYLFEYANQIMVHQQGSDEYDHQYIWYQQEGELTGELHDDFPLVCKHPINLIGVKAEHYGGMIDGNAITRLFNLSTSQCWIGMDATVGWELGYSSGFEWSVQHGVCEILREYWGKEGTARCAQKLVDKYPTLLWRFCFNKHVDTLLPLKTTRTDPIDIEAVHEWAAKEDEDVFDL